MMDFEGEKFLKSNEKVIDNKVVLGNLGSRAVLRKQ